MTMEHRGGQDNNDGALPWLRCPRQEPERGPGEPPAPPAPRPRHSLHKGYTLATCAAVSASALVTTPCRIVTGFPAATGTGPPSPGVELPILTRLGVRRGSKGNIMQRISPVLAGLAVFAAAGCGTARATPPKHLTPPCLRTSNMITQAGSGKTYCVRVGDQVAIFLRSTRPDRWLEPLASGHVLEAVPNGAGSLIAGATAIWYRAGRPGRSVVTS